MAQGAVRDLLYSSNKWGDCRDVYFYVFWVADVATTKLIWWILIGVAICIIVGVTSMAYVETLYMKAQLKQEIKELRKLKREIKEDK